MKTQDKLEPPEMVLLQKNSLRPARTRWPRGIFRFKRGETVWVRDHPHKSPGGFTIVKARVIERHYHPGRHPGYPGGEGYRLQGDLWWDCYPGVRVHKTRDHAIAARIDK
jgi:hypothetical protein